MSRNDGPYLELHPHSPHSVAAALPPAAELPHSRPAWRSPRRLLQAALLFVAVVAMLSVAGWFGARHWVQTTARAALPQLDGSITVQGLAAPVTVLRDAHGVPHISAASVDDLIYAQAFVVTGDRLFQMDLLRRHAAGELAEVLGASLVDHDKLQRTLQVRAAADRAIAQLPADQKHLLEVYARGVNASIAQQRDHLPLEFHILGYTPAPWTPRDSILVSLAMFEDLTTGYPAKLAREALSVRLPPNLVPDLYPVGSWRDHPPTTPEPDLTLPGPEIEQVPLDESQSKLMLPTLVKQAPTACPECTPGSNNWVVAGSHTADGKPLLSNDMHLAHSLPGIWYEADLAAPGVHVSGVSIPGLPLIVVGHNEHIAWGFTNLGADVQDLYLETTRNAGSAEEFLAIDNTWQPVVHLVEPIRVKHGVTRSFEVLATRHGDALTPILTPVLPGETRSIALRWTAYDPAVLQLPTLAIAQAHDWPGFLAAIATFGGPAQNVVYADDQGHIGYDAVGRIPLRGPAVNAEAPLPNDLASPETPRDPGESPDIAATPNPLGATDLALATPTAPQRSGPLSPVPVVPAAAHEWSGYIPFDQLPQAFDPPGGVIATANARIVPDDYPYPTALNWAAPYRNERLWRVLAGRTGLVPADMLAIQSDVYSDFDHVLAERLAYALDRSPQLAGGTYKAGRTRSLHQAADLLRSWNGRMTADSPAAALVFAVHAQLWPMLLTPHLQGKPPADFATTYVWGERDYALEQILMHTPPRWLPPAYAGWDDFLTAAVDRALYDAHAPADLATWRFGVAHTVDIESPVFAQSALLRHLLGMPTGTGPQPQSGDNTTIKQVGHTFGPSERFTASLGDLDQSTLNIVSGESGNPLSPWFLDQFPAWLHGTTFPMPFSRQAVKASATHTLTLTPR